MATVITSTHKVKILQAIGSHGPATDLIANVVAKSGTLKASTRRHMDLLCADPQVSKRICDIIDAGTGTLRASDRKILVIGIADYQAGHTLANAIDGI